MIMVEKITRFEFHSVNFEFVICKFNVVYIYTRIYMHSKRERCPDRRFECTSKQNLLKFQNYPRKLVSAVIQR